MISYLQKSCKDHAESPHIPSHPASPNSTVVKMRKPNIGPLLLTKLPTLSWFSPVFPVKSPCCSNSSLAFHSVYCSSFFFLTTYFSVLKALCLQSPAAHCTLRDCSCTASTRRDAQRGGGEAFALEQFCPGRKSFASCRLAWPLCLFSLSRTGWDASQISYFLTRYCVSVKSLQAIAIFYSNLKGMIQPSSNFVRAATKRNEKSNQEASFKYRKTEW